MEVYDPIAWAIWFEASDAARVLDGDYVTVAGGAVVHVSTVFLGLDHRSERGGDPVLWETMIFGGDLDNYQRRYTSKAEALAGHREALALVLPDVVQILVNGEAMPAHSNIKDHEVER